MKKTQPTLLGRNFTLAAASLLAAASASAANITWNGTPPATWDTVTSNWAGEASTFTNGDNVTFGATGAGLINLGEAVSFGTMAINAGAYRFIGNVDNAYNLGGTGGLVISPGSGQSVVFTNIHVDSQSAKTRATFAGGTDVQSGTLQLRFSRGAEATAGAAYNVSFGTGAISLATGTTLRFNGVSGSANNTTYLLQNTVNVNGNATFNLDRAAGAETSGTNSGNFSGRLAGQVNLGANLTIAASTGGGPGTGQTHGISGNIVINQATAGSRSILRDNNTGNQGFSISGNIIDGAGSAGNGLTLQTGNSTTTSHQFNITGTGNTYSGGTTILTSSALVADATAGNSRAIIVAATSSLGTGNVTVNDNGLLTLLGSDNLANSATLTLNDGGFLHLGTGVNLEITQLFAYKGTGLTSISAGVYDVTQLNAFFGNNSFGESTFYGLGSITIAAVPEPSTFALLAGLATLGFAASRRRRA